MPALSTHRRWGHVVGITVSLANAIPTAFVDNADEVGPPASVIAFSAAVGLACAGLLVWSWAKDARGPRRAAAVLMTLAALSAMPAFLVSGVPAPLQIAAGLYILGTIAAIVLLFYPEPQLAI